MPRAVDARPGADARGTTDATEPTPVGRWFVYAASEDLGPGPSIHTRLFAVNLDAPEAPRLAISLADDRIVYGFVFSPDRRRVAYGLRGLSDDRVGIYMVDFSSGQPGQSVVVDDRAGTIGSYDLAWSTDGRYLAYSTWHANPVGWDIKVIDMSGAVPGPVVVADEVALESGGSVRWINENILAYKASSTEQPLRFVSRTPAGSWVPTVLETGIVRLFYVDSRPHPPAALVTEGCSGAFIDFAAARMRSVVHGIIGAENLTWVAERTPDGTWSIFPGSATVQPAVATLTGGLRDLSSPRCDSGVWSHHGAMLSWIDNTSYAVRVTSFDAAGTPTTLPVGGSAQTDSVMFSPNDRWLLIHGSYYRNPALARLHDGVVDDARPIAAPDTDGGAGIVVEDVAFQQDGAFVFFVRRDASTGARAIYRASLGTAAMGQPQSVAQLPGAEMGALRYSVSGDGRTLVYIIIDPTGTPQSFFAVDLTQTQLPPRPLIPGPNCAVSAGTCSDLLGWEVLP